MPAFNISDARIFEVNPALFVPSLTTWSRLETLPTTADLSPALQAPIADPLWFMLRQWQFKEFQGEDAGTPIEVRLAGEQARLARYLPGPLGADAAQRATDYQHQRLPLEVVIEQEPVRSRHPRLAADAGLHWLRLLAAAGIGQLGSLYRDRYPLTIPPVADSRVDPKGAAWQLLLQGRGLDGHAFATELRPLVGADNSITTLPAQPEIPGDAIEIVKQTASRWLRWYDQTLSEPTETNQAWNPQRQEYACALSAQFSDGEVVLTADEYTDGRLDWYSFRITNQLSLGAPTEPVPVEALAPRPLLPTLVRYPGMPVDRYWEFEDGQVALGQLETGPTDLARMLLVEFALVYGNDWFVIPVELPIGSLFRVSQFLVKDTFGVQTQVNPVSQSGKSPWTMFSLSPEPNAPDTLRNLFFLPPTLPRKLEGDPIEEVALFRDEMANMVWAVEHKVQGAAGDACDRRLAASRQTAHQLLEGNPVAAELLYRLATPVPENWIPFVPVPTAPNQPLDAFAIQLERRALLKNLLDGTRVKIQPHGLLLRSNPNINLADEPPLRLEEEEVPREGIIVKRNFQCTRWLDGRRHLWLGRNKMIGKGEGASGLRFDVALPTTEKRD
jgi:hypothetical protein